VVEIERGPVITMYELELAPGTKVGKVVGLSDDLAIALKAPSVRIVAPLLGKSSIGVEVPNIQRKTVMLRELLDTAEGVREKMAIPILIGKDVAGNPVISDLASMPHLLIAGTTGSGKSVCLNSIILSILFLRHPSEVQLLLVDPKMVEFSSFREIPHLISPVVTDMKKAAAVLEWAVNKMEERYALLASVGVKHIYGYNRLGASEIKKRLNPEGNANLEDVPYYLPHIVIVVDELADLMMVASKEVETSVIRLSQKSRAVGIHLILATQRPSVDVITGLIKSNLPSRISFYVASKVDSRTILDQNGAEKLLGSGDMLFLPPGTSKLVRVQGAYVSDEEVKNVVEYLKGRSAPQFNPELKGWKRTSEKDDSVRDELYNEAVRIVLETQRGSVSLLQRRLEIGYSRAAKLIDLMAEDGIVGEYKGSQAREVFLTLEEWDAQMTRMNQENTDNA
ncbi:MAG: DNA translocase FtsK, partial [Planctomycetota bacterium]